MLKLLPFGGAAISGALIGNEIGHGLGFDPSVKPAVEFEQRQFNDLLRSNDQTDLQQKVDALNLSILKIKLSPITTTLASDQLAELVRQRDILQQLLDRTPRAGTPSGVTPPIGGTDSASHHRGSGRGKASLVDPLIAQLVAAGILPNTALGADVVNPKLLPFDEQTRILRQIRDNKNKPAQVNVALTVQNNLSASLLGARIYQLSTSAKLREG